MPPPEEGSPILPRSPAGVYLRALACPRLVPSRPPDPVVARLRFAVDDVAEAARVFSAWRSDGGADALEQSQIWAYAYIQRYLTAKFLRERTGGPSDFDQTFTRAVSNALGSFDRIRDPTLFPHYVSVIAKRELLTHRAKRQTTVEFDEAVGDAEADDGAGEALDRPFVRQTLRAAVAELPASIREVAELRLFGGMGYEDIAEQTGRPLPTVRTYLSKAIHRLREHPSLRALYNGDPGDA